MKTVIIFLAILLAPQLFFAQESIGIKDISDWTVFSGSPNQPQFKKINDSLFFAFYRQTSDDAGIMVFNKNLKVWKNIAIKLTNNEKAIFNLKSAPNLIDFPAFYYRESTNSVVLIGKSKFTDTDFAILALNYSLNSDSLIGVDTLKISKLVDFDIKLSDNDKFIAIAEKRIRDKNTTTNKNLEKQIYDVFSSDCKKKYSVQLDMPKSAESYFKVFANGELVHGQAFEKGKKTELKFSKFDIEGTLSGTAEFIAPIEDIFSYRPEKFLMLTSNGIYCVCSKVREQMEGYVIFKLDFSQNTCSKIVDKEFDKASLVKMYKSAEIDLSMVERKKVKPLTKLKNFYIHSAYIDKAGIYVLLEDMWKEYHQFAGGGHETVISYASENVITMGYNFNGSEMWANPIKRDALCIDVEQSGNQLNFYNPHGSGIGIKTFEDENYINMIIPSMGNIYATRIDKGTGKEARPILLNNEQKTYTNSNSWFYINSTSVVITTMRGIYTLIKKEIYLDLMVLKY